MAQTRIDKYMATWETETKVGIIKLYKHLGGNKYENIATIDTKDPIEFMALVDILRNEKPVVYREKNKAITTGTEPTGEEEGK
ncbi:MAG: hypothetical protein ACTSPY_11460 [Candidatus Helarchaeota archaeon]